jgi:hypothetical protein
MNDYSIIKDTILKALQHPEAEDGLYFNNLIAVHEEEERPCVEGDEVEILEALRELIQTNQICTSDKDGNTIFHLKTSN